MAIWMSQRKILIGLIFIFVKTNQKIMRVEATKFLVSTMKFLVGANKFLVRATNFGGDQKFGYLNPPHSWSSQK